MKSGYEKVQHLSICWYLKPWSDPFPGFQARKKNILLTRGLKRKSYTTLLVGYIEQEVLDKTPEKNPSNQKQAERPSNGRKQCEEWDAKFQVEGWSTLSPCVKGHINRQESIRSSNPDGRGKLMGTEYQFPLMFFLDLSIQGCNLEMLLSKFRWCAASL